jgi:hypothetical protein
VVARLQSLKETLISHLRPYAAILGLRSVEYHSVDRFALTEADARCAITNKLVLSAGEPFHVFPSGYVVLGSALKKEVMLCFDEKQHESNTRNTRTNRYWTPEEDVKLATAVAKTRKKRWGKEFKIDWVAITVLVPSRTRNQCKNRWYTSLDPSIDQANGRTGTWNEDEDIKLKAAVQHMVARIGLRLPRWFRVERENSAIIGGLLPWIPASTVCMDVRVNGKLTKTSS